ncbi:hypothetical protein GKE82_26185 [Conexibacter sp. W3-3-2]|uniref:hypothetical protein n=1 Tax=Conexibacter sp. W3-3-2 TaxID=2675227 RepID=UPI0012B6C366|nr:hypothetical protein [Conexibacter sp. W3-3-2]MTD47610.1 hypothetical protein [Conexibacter sp. W3-3-2]MTD47695.1 hypothetical protein [Conexibacter sp. W3-3-2]
MAAAIAAAFAGCADDDAERQPVIEAAPVIRQAPSPAGQDQYTPEQARKERRAQEAMPALQDLPFTGGGVRVELVDVAPDGRLVVKVTAASERQARRGYRRWLARSGDSGARFVPLYRWTAAQRSTKGRR